MLIFEKRRKDVDLKKSHIFVYSGLKDEYPLKSLTFFGAGEAECRDVLLSGVLLSGVLLSGVGHSSVMSGVFALDRRAARCLVLISLALVRVRIRRSSSFGVGGGRPVPGGGSRGLVITGRSPYLLKWMRHS